MKRLTYLPTFIVFLALSTASLTWGAEAELRCQEGSEMGTPFKICVFAKPEQNLNLQADLTKCFSLIREIDLWMSEWRPNTLLSEVNASAGARPVKVISQLYDIVKLSLDIARETNGAFDPTFNALWGLYNFKKGQEREPTDEELSERLPLINYQNVEMNSDAKTIFLKKPGMKLGLGGIGQGYAVDRVVEFLKNRGYSAGFVDGSGDTYFFGKKPKGELWKVGVRNPFHKDKSTITIYGSDFAVTTSGDDEKFFMKGQQRIHHILDPKTGRPAQGLRQVTVIAKTATEADAFDTAFFVMGKEKAISLAAKKGFGLVAVTPDQKTTISDNLKLKKTEWGDVFTWRND